MNIKPNTSNELELSNEELIASAVKNGEGVIASNGAFSTTTGERTGRSPNDRFIVDEPGTSDLIDWGEVNKPFDENKFDSLWDKVEDYLSENDGIFLMFTLALMMNTIYQLRLQLKQRGIHFLLD